MPSQPIAFCEDFCLSPAHLIQSKQHPDPSRGPEAKFSTTHAPFHANLILKLRPNFSKPVFTPSKVLVVWITLW
jgi:hypothetical protein